MADNISKTSYKEESRISYHSNLVNDIICVTFPSDGEKRIISCSNDSTIKIFHIGQNKVESVIKNDTLVNCLEFFYEKFLLFADEVGQVQVYQLRGTKFEKYHKVKIDEKEIWRFRVDQDANIIARVKDGRVLKYPNFRKQYKRTMLIYKHPGLVHSNVALLNSVEGHCVVGGADPNCVVKIDYRDHGRIRIDQFETKHVGQINTVETYEIRGKTERIFVGSQDHTVSLWDVEGKFIIRVGCNEPVYSCLPVVFDKNEEAMVLLGGISGGVMSFTNEKNVQSEIKSHERYINSLCVVENNEKLNVVKFGTCSDDYRVVTYKIQNVRPKQQTNSSFNSGNTTISSQHVDQNMLKKVKKLEQANSSLKLENMSLKERISELEEENERLKSSEKPNSQLDGGVPTENLQQFFDRVELTKYLEPFQKDDINIRDLEFMEDSDLRDYVEKGFVRKRLLREVQKLFATTMDDGELVC